MATNLDRDLCCAICLDVYQDPILLRCGHSFCRHCIVRHIAESTEILCPHCQAEFEEDLLYSDQALANIVAGVLELRVNTETRAANLQCVKHREELKMFCRDDNQLICLICALSQGHKGHTCISKDDAVQECKDTTERLREDIGEQFEVLHSFLNEKERALIQKLADEEERVVKMLEENVVLLTRECDAMEAIIREIRTVVNSEVPTALQFDRRTANPLLCISNCGRKLEYCKTPSTSSDIPERFTNYLSVVAFMGFTSGTHYWEVHISEDSDWFLGLAAASVNRKVCVVTSPEHGYWSIRHKSGDDYWAYGTEKVVINPDVNLEKIGIYLDYEGGQLSFYDAEDMSHIHTFNNTFTEKLYPFFSVDWKENNVISPVELFQLQL